MQVLARFGVDPPIAATGRAGHWTSLKATALVLLFLLSAIPGFAAPAATPTAGFRPQASTSAVLESLREVLVSRWAFQKRHPLAIKAFAKELMPQEVRTLEADLRAEAEASSSGLPGVWKLFTLGLCAETVQPGNGEVDLQAAAKLAEGGIAINYEMARILQGAGMFQRALAHQKETQRAMLRQGYVRLPELAKAELKRAREALSAGRHQASGHSLDFAGRLDPHAPWMPLLALELHMREHAPWEWDLGEVWALAVETAQHLRHYDSLSLFLLNASRIFRIGLGIFGCLCAAFLLARHFFRIAHPFAERLPQAVEMRVRYLAIALVPLSLAVGGAGYAALCMLAAAFLWRHSSVQEKSILKAILTGLAILPLLLLWEQSMGRHLDPATGVHLYHKSYGRGMEAGLMAQIEASRPKSPEDTAFRALAASLAYKKHGNLIRAKDGSELALRASTADPLSHSLAKLHAGNLAFLGFEYDKAAALYASVRQGNPDMVEAWFNGSQAELYSNRSNKHKQFLDRAAEIDPQRVTAFLKDNDDLFAEVPPSRKAMDPMLGAMQALRAAWRGAIALEFLGLPVRSGIFEFPSAWLIGAVALLALGLYFRFRNYSQRLQGRDLFECKICNRVMCRTCRKGVHCQHCFKAVAGVHDNRLRTDLVVSLRNRSRSVEGRTGRLLDLAFPGAGRLYLGETSGRFGWTLATSLGFGCLLGMRDLLMEYPFAAMGPAVWLPGLPLVAVYVIHHLQMLRPGALQRERVAVPAVTEREAIV